MSPTVITVEPKDDYTLLLTFDNGEQKIFDVKHLLDFGIFKELRNINYFKKVKVDPGVTICWPNEQDICPDTLYLKSIPYQSEN